MKCPKCGYLGFEAVDRCRNCGFDLTLPTPRPQVDELPLHSTSGSGSPFDDFALVEHAKAPDLERPALDLDRLIGAPNARPSPPDDQLPLNASDKSDPSPAGAVGRPGSPANRLPLFDRSQGADELPAVAPPRPAGSPLAVRRSAPELPRVRPKGASRTARQDDRPLVAAAEPARLRPSSPLVPLPPEAAPAPPAEPASRLLRTLAALIDFSLLVGISAGVIYLTLRIADLALADWSRLPIVPMSAFLLMLNGGYLVAFTAAGGRTIGKMLTGVQVLGDDGRAVGLSNAVLRALGNLLTVGALGLPFVLGLVSADRRAMADRMAGTQVVKAR